MLILDCVKNVTALIQEVQKITKHFSSNEELSSMSECLYNFVEYVIQFGSAKNKKNLFKKEAFNAFLGEIIHVDTRFTNQAYDFSGTDACNLARVNSKINEQTSRYKNIYFNTESKVNQLLTELKNITCADISASKLK